MHRLLAIAVVSLTNVAAARADDWKPAAGPLATRWAAKVDPARPLPEHPRPTLVRKEWLNLNGLWQFARAVSGEAPPLGRELDKRILVPYPVESALSGRMERADRVWYRRLVRIPEAWRGRRVLLHFGAVDWEAKVWVNGSEIGTHRGGYDGFSFDITGALKHGAEDELIVGVFDPTSDGRQARGKQVTNPHGIWYTPTTGIWQTVWLEPVPETHAVALRAVPDVDRSSLGVTVDVRGPAADLAVRAVALADGVEVARAEGRPGAELSLSIPAVRLWTPDTPFLYDLRVEVRRGAAVVDAVESYFGMRKIAIGKDAGGVTRILLNGEFVFQLGPLDQGFWPDGLYTAPTDEALRYDIEVTKRLGFNMARKHVKVEPERWYYWCDRLGLLVWQDMPSGDAHVASGAGEVRRSAESATQFEAELRRLVEGRGHHPSIVLWVVFNEGWGQYDTERLTRWVKTLDPTRLVTCASGWNDMPAGDIVDIHAYPGPGSPRPEAARAAVLGEFGGLGLPLPGHTWQAEKNWGYKSYKTIPELEEAYRALVRRLRPLAGDPGLSAAVYTQTTDVEIEVNGLMTYDREVLKLTPEAVAEVNRKLYLPPPRTIVVVPTSESQGLEWRYALEEPAGKWFEPTFDDAAWSRGPGGFGTRGTPGSVVRTEWNTPQVWARRAIELRSEDLAGTAEMGLLVHHDEDAEVYLNGVLAATVTGYTTSYTLYDLAPAARATLRAGRNTLAVHCRQTGGGQYIDVGVVRIVEAAER